MASFIGIGSCTRIPGTLPGRMPTHPGEHLLSSVSDSLYESLEASGEEGHAAESISKFQKISK